MNFKIIYQLVIHVYELALWLGALFSGKVRRMLIGRTTSLSRIRKFRSEQPDRELIWFHAASVGEFEQALPVIKLLKEIHPDLAVAVSFYSPSGFELRYKHPLADVSFYLPSDRTQITAKLIKTLRPKALVLVKYEFWYNLIFTAKRLSLPVISVCCILKPNALNRWPYSTLLKNTFPLIRHFFVQNIETSQMLTGMGFNNITLNGDTRVDRVLEIKEQDFEIDWVEPWKADHKLLVIGSAWTEDIMFMKNFLQHAVVEAHGLWRVLIAPHEIGENHLNHLTHALSLPYELYSNWKDEKPDTDILVLNTMGMLSKLYRFADAAWIGGAFKTGLHNTLEAAVYGIPVGFGPKYAKFQEATDLVKIGVAKTYPEMGSVWEFFQQSTEIEEERERIRNSATLYFERQRGASKAIVTYLDGLLSQY